jgi:hypothetical protein
MPFDTKGAPSGGAPAGQPALDNDEAHMRRALGLSGSRSQQTAQQLPEQARQRHRFVRDGEVQVAVINRSADSSGPHGSRSAIAEAALQAERSAHAATRRLLEEAQASVQSLQTRLAHAELAHREALAAAEVSRSVAPAAEPVAAAVTDNAEYAEIESPLPRRRGRPRLERPAPAPKPVKVKPVVQAEAEDDSEDTGPEPVKWWLPGFATKAKRTKRAR